MRLEQPGDTQQAECTFVCFSCLPLFMTVLLLEVVMPHAYEAQPMFSMVCAQAMPVQCTTWL